MAGSYVIRSKHGTFLAVYAGMWSRFTSNVTEAMRFPTRRTADLHLWGVGEVVSYAEARRRVQS